MLSFILNRKSSHFSLLYREMLSLYINNIFQFFIHPFYKSIPFWVKNEKMLNYKIPSMNKKNTIHKQKHTIGKKVHL